MRKQIAVAFGVGILTVCTFSGIGAQQAVTFDQSLFVPQRPELGDTIEVDGKGVPCHVTEVRREWVLCAPPENQREFFERRAVWHNVYNGHTYTVWKNKKK